MLDNQAVTGKNLSLAGKVAVVTGASRGIGRAIACAMAAEGAAVAINYNGSEARALEVKQEIEAAGGVEAETKKIAELAQDFRKKFQEKALLKR